MHTYTDLYIKAYIIQCFIDELYVKIQVNMRMTSFCDLYAKTSVLCSKTSIQNNRIMRLYRVFPYILQKCSFLPCFTI